MKLFRRVDILFEEAGADPVKLDSLIAKHQRDRAQGAVLLVVVNLVFLGLVAWLFLDLAHWIHSGSSNLSTGVEWVTGHRGLVSLLGLGAFYWNGLMFVILTSVGDKLKMLLVARGMRNTQLPPE